MQTLPAAATESRHLPHARNPAKSSSDPWQSCRHEVRAIAKKLAAANDPFTCRRLGFACALNGGLEEAAAAPCPALAGRHTSVRAHHFEEQLRGRAAPGAASLPVASAALLGSRAVTAATGVSPGQRGGGARRAFKRDRYTPADLDDDLALAKSRVRMPCDDNSRNTAASAAAAAAAATPARGGSSVHTESPDEAADRAQVAALYAAGLLYADDAGPRDGRGPTLDSIPRDEPAYVVRSAKPRGARKRGGRTLAELDRGLNLSFSDLGDEESVVQYVMALTASEADAARSSSTLSSPTLRAIQEMDGDETLETWVVLDSEDA